MLKIIDKYFFEQIFCHTLETLPNKLINRTNKDKNRIIVRNINETKKKFMNKKKRRLMVG